ncbi:MAG: DUF1800 domain-containing protein [Casimicrobiaceae bacterium]
MPPTRFLAAAAALSLAAGIAAAAPMGFDDARHLLVRTGFGPSDAEVRTFASLSREQAVAQLLRDTRTSAVTAPPGWTADESPLRYPRPETATPEERKAFQQQQVRQGLELRAWWVQEMLATPSPLTERMTLFWHNHFVSSQQKVRFARLMYAQNAMLRANALGSFATLLHAASKEPAMLLYLDVAQSRKGQPNENFAREVMELFTLGEGQYTEADIKEAARAFTGWSLDRETGQYLFRPGIHDYGVKTVLGRSGRFDGDNVLDVILAKPETAEFITAKLWREFVSADPDPREIRRIAQILRGQEYDMKAALRALFLSEAFWARDNRGTLVKSPVELVVGTLRQLEIAPGSAMPFAVAAAGMGQNLFSPPNVKGWPGGETWINSNTLLARKQFLDRIVRTDDRELPMAMMAIADVPGARIAGEPMAKEMRIPKAAVAPQGAQDEDKVRAQRFAQQMDRSLRNVPFDASAWVARRPGATPVAKAQEAQALLLPLAPVTADPPRGDVDAVALVHATLLDPAYQLK